MTTIDHADIIARVIADPVAWVPDLFDTDPDLCANSSDGPLFVLGQR